MTAPRTAVPAAVEAPHRLALAQAIVDAAAAGGRLADLESQAALAEAVAAGVPLYRLLPVVRLRARGALPWRAEARLRFRGGLHLRPGSGRPLAETLRAIGATRAEALRGLAVLLGLELSGLQPPAIAAVPHDPAVMAAESVLRAAPQDLPAAFAAAYRLLPPCAGHPDCLTCLLERGPEPVSVRDDGAWVLLLHDAEEGWAELLRNTPAEQVAWIDPALVHERCADCAIARLEPALPPLWALSILGRRPDGSCFAAAGRRSGRQTDGRIEEGMVIGEGADLVAALDALRAAMAG